MKFYGGKKKHFQMVSVQKIIHGIQLFKKCDKLITADELDISNNFTSCKPLTKEAYYYRQVFTDLYSNKFGNIIPSFWVPKWSNTTDPSARSLKIYSNKNDQYKEQTL